MTTAHLGLKVKGHNVVDVTPSEGNSSFGCVIYCKLIGNVHVAVQNVEFAMEPGQSQETSLMLLNAGTIMLDVSFEPNSYADLFTITPENCQLEPGGTTDVLISFHAPTSTQSTAYERSDMHKLCELISCSSIQIYLSRTDTLLIINLWVYTERKEGSKGKYRAQKINWIGISLFGFCLKCFDTVGWMAGRASGL